jgi:tRNA(Ile)-lysidine synthase TilS/MesJ
MKIADNPFSNVHGFVVDHNLRENSTTEAISVAQQLRKLEVKAVVLPMRWKDEIRRGLHPPDLPNLESLARKYRYQLIGKNCSFLGINSLFFAHHSDDQYETILMRLLSGHGYRGLQGIRAANEIPECYEIHKVYKSGLIDDQHSDNPFLNFKPPSRLMKELRSAYRRNKIALDGLDFQSYYQSGPLEFGASMTRHRNQDVPYMAPLSCEDGGVTIYRPLLGFSKDRLIATCEANNVTWFEDATNKDPTLTTRNAIRYLVKHHDLPKALQKPSVLALSQRARRRIKQEEGEAQRILVRKSVIKDFDSNVGTLLVELPQFGPTGRKTLWTEARERARTPSRRIIVGVLVRKLIEYVTPEHTLPPLTNLDNVVDRLFPQFSYDPQLSQPPKAFSIAGVVFSPVPGPQSTKWFLSRAPYSTSKETPKRSLPKAPPSSKSPGAESPEQVHRHVSWRSWKGFKLWDGRFWIHISSCVNANFHIHPLHAEYLKPFRMALNPEQRARLERLLKYHAPGKVRYTLPAIYSVEPDPEGGESPIMTLLALPSLGIHIPGMERWIRYELRYRHVDLSLLSRWRGQNRRAILRSPHGESQRLRRIRLARAFHMAASKDVSQPIE